MTFRGAVALSLCLLAPPAVAAEGGLVAVPSQNSVPQTVDRLEAALMQSNADIIAGTGHRRAQAERPVAAPPERLVVFAYPLLEERLRACAPTVALDLPLRVLVWEDSAGAVWLSYSDPAFVAQRHGLGGCNGAVQELSSRLLNATAAAARPHSVLGDPAATR